MNEDIFHLGIKAIIRNEEGKILLLKVDHRKLIGIDEAYWDIPGGRLKKGSTMKDTLSKEISEETGIDAGLSCKPFQVAVSPLRIPVEGGDVGMILWTYLCETADVGEIQLSDEHTESGWFTPEEASMLLAVKYPKEFTEKIRGLQ